MLSCSPNVPSKTKKDFQELKVLLGESEISELHQRYSEFTISGQILVKEEASTNREKSAIKLSTNKSTSVLSNRDKSCGFIKVLNYKTNFI